MPVSFLYGGSLEITFSPFYEQKKDRKQSNLKDNFENKNIFFPRFFTLNQVGLNS